MAYRLIFDVEAEADLAEIEAYLGPRSPAGAANVLGDIWTALLLLPEHPFMGRKSADGVVRLRTTSRYRYVIAYEVVGEEIRIRAIFHPRENRPY
jgi:plasmid stabilization system protein ParE